MRRENPNVAGCQQRAVPLTFGVKSLEEMNYVSWVEILSEKVGGVMDLFLLKRLAKFSKKVLFAIKSFLVFDRWDNWRQRDR